MARLKLALIVLLVFLSGGGTWKLPVFEANANLEQPPTENAFASTGNENLISNGPKAQNRLLKINFAVGEDVNDRKIAAHRDILAASNRIKSGKIQFESVVDLKEAEVTDTIVDVSKTTTKPPKKSRRTIKLNIKQGLIMNQILSTYGLNDPNNSLCKDHVNEFKSGLRALEPWALKMFDASSKLMPGILGGNLAEFGSWNQCLNIRKETDSGVIRGRHCAIFIYPSDKLVRSIVGFNKNFSEQYFINLKKNILEDVKIMWSVCVPDSCGHTDVLSHFRKIVAEVGEGLNLTLGLDKEHCVSVDDLPKLTRGDYIYLFCVCSILIMVLVCSVIDWMSSSAEEINEVISLFSLKRNMAILFSTSANRNDIRCLHGIRFLSVYFIVYGHRFVHDLATPVVNYMDLVGWLESYRSTTIHGATITVDTFIVVASTLVSYIYFNVTAKGVKINILLFYLNRHLRLLVPLGLAIGTYVTVAKHFGGGPLYYDFAKANRRSCGNYWWATLLNIQPFVNPRDMCIVQTWFLSIDMFWYYVSPFLLLAMQKNCFTGYLLLFVVYSVCTATNFYVAWIHEFNGQMPVSPKLLSSDYFAFHYTQPIVRGGPYILGLAFGHALFRTKDQKVTISPFTNTLGWIAVSICLPFIVLITRWFRLEDFHYNRTLASLFLATHRTLWSFGIMWIIWVCQQGYGGTSLRPANTFLSLDIFKVLGRLGYNVYLFHYLFQSAVQNSKKTPSYFSHFLSSFESLADVVLILLLSIPLTLCFEFPFNRLCTLLFRMKSSETNKIIQVKPQDLKQ